jgi:hypothetical protein
MRLARSAWSLCLLSGYALVGCSYSPHPKNGAQQCGTGTPRCPEGYVCAWDNHCYVQGQAPAAPDGALPGLDSSSRDQGPEANAAVDATFADEAISDVRRDAFGGTDLPAENDTLARPEAADAGPAEANDTANTPDSSDASDTAGVTDLPPAPDLTPPAETGLDLRDVAPPDSPTPPEVGPPDLAPIADLAPEVALPDLPPADLPTDVCPPSTTSDPNNCGACGHRCWGGACVASKCQPTEVASGQHEPGDIVVDGNNVYWAATADGKVLMAPRRGGSVQVVAEGQDRPIGVLLDEGYLYWANNSVVASIWRRPVTLASPANLVAGNLYDAYRMAIQGSRIYWTEESTTGAIHATDKAGGGTTQNLFTEQASPRGIVADGVSLYWTAWQHVLRTPIAIGALSPVSDAESFPFDLRADADNLYWLDGYTPAIRKAGKTSSGAAVTLASLTTTADCPQVALDDSAVYFSDPTGPTISSVSKLGGPITVWVSSGLGHPKGIAADAELIFWTDAGTGQVMRLAK